MQSLEQQKTDEMYMRRCIQLARNGAVGAPPNPMVGAVVVCDGRIIGEGYHRRCGGPHAEVNAIASVADKSLLGRSTIYVSLEPCAHYGKTPPCADLIVSHRIPRVVVGCQDPFAKVDGLGLKKLRDAGAEVVVGVLEKECLALNARFVTYHTLHRPFISMKWAKSGDGYIDRTRADRSEGDAYVFSTPTTQALVHRLRATHMAILVGSRTALLDDPSLTTRSWPGETPLRLVVDMGGRLAGDLRLLADGLPTLVYTAVGKLPKADAEHPAVTYVPLNENEDTLPQIMRDLYNRGVQTLLVEGGSATLQSFIDAGLWDEAYVESAPQKLGEGIAEPRLADAEVVESRMVDGHRLTHYRRR